MGVSVVVLCRLEVINERPLNSQKKRTVVLTEKAAKDTFQYVSISGYKLPPSTTTDTRSIHPPFCLHSTITAFQLPK